MLQYLIILLPLILVITKIIYAAYWCTSHIITKITTSSSVDCCANCGKEGSDINNTCNKCKAAKYCNVACKKKHRTKHKKDCAEHVKRAAEIQAELHYEEELFKPPPPPDDCPICFLRLPSLHTGRTYKPCCGKLICNGCVHAPLYDNMGNIIRDQKCPFCRTPAPSSKEEMIKQYKKRVEANDANGIYNLGCIYRDGKHGLTQDYDMALELWKQAAELGGCSRAYHNIGYSYSIGAGGVGQDIKKATHYYKLAAIGGNVLARCNLAIAEVEAGYMKNALAHYTIAAGSGHIKSLKEIQKFYTNGMATKENYATALRAYQTFLMEIKSEQRDKAAATQNNPYY